MRSRKRFTKKAMLKRFGDLAVAVADIPYKARPCAITRRAQVQGAHAQGRACLSVARASACGSGYY